MQKKLESSISRIIVWLRNDLRLHDNYALDLARKLSSENTENEILPIYCFDPRIYNCHTKFNSKKTGVIRTRFQIETISDLRQSL